MTHVSLDSQADAVKQFVLGLRDDARESLLELNGKAIACVVPPPKSNGAAAAAAWTDAKNARRIELIKKKHAEGRLPPEHLELAGLQDEMLRFRQKVAPLPLEDAQRLHQELLMQAANKSSA